MDLGDVTAILALVVSAAALWRSWSLEAQQKRPKVIPELTAVQTRSGGVYVSTLTLTNTGVEPAFDVSFSLAPAYSSYLKMVDGSESSETIPDIDLSRAMPIRSLDRDQPYEFKLSWPETSAEELKITVTWKPSKNGEAEDHEFYRRVVWARA